MWITGASSGIGEEIAYAFARLGCRIVISGTRREELERVRNRCEMLSSDCQVKIICGDVSDTKLHSGWLQEVTDTFGRLFFLNVWEHYRFYHPRHTLFVIIVRKFSFCVFSGEVHVLVNNAGRSQRSDFEKVPEQIERELFDVNVFAVMSLTRLLVARW